MLMIGSSAALMLLGMVAAFGIAPNTVVYSGDITEVADILPAPPVELVPPDAGIHAREIRVRRGDTVSGLLADLSVHDQQIRQFLNGSPEANALFRQLAPGKTISVQVDADGALHALLFPLNGERDTALKIERTDNGYAADIRELPREMHLRMQSAVIRHSLFGAADEAGIPDAIAVDLAEIFAGDIDFHRDLRQGDRFSVIYEMASHQGKPLRSQKVLAAEFVNKGRTYHAFWHTGPDGKGGYYTAEGRSVKKSFLRSPLEFSRISSGFSTARLHPVLGTMRAHRGIDYAAPTGTRVRTTGDGVVDFVGNQGGYGKVIIIRHAAGKTTLYAHLSGFAAGIRKGARVAQGETIGFVGATGMATGPHLHYEFRIAGVHRDPLTVTFPDAAPLAQSELPAYLAQAEIYLSQIAAIRDIRYVMLD